MSSKIYGKLAITNLKNNRKTYVPYILMAVLSVMMYYIVGGMAQGNNGLSKNVKMIMGYMNGLLMIFSVIFLFYTNSFLIKRRKREIGIYNILGMGKGHIAKMLAIEAVITAFISIFGGILLGIVFGKLMYLVLGKLLHYDISVKFTVEIPVLEKTFVFFMAIFVLILLYNLLQIRIVSPVELLHGSNQGEREPKTKWLLAIVGAILLGTGYYIAQTTGNPLAHTVLRGSVNPYGRSLPNYHYEDLSRLNDLYQERELLNPAAIIDANHNNSGKKFEQQIRIVKEVMHSRKVNPDIHSLVKGVMIESYIEEGNQKIGEGVYGKSITDPCLGWADSEKLLYELAELNV